MAEITLEDVSRVFPDGTSAVTDVDIVVPDGKLLVLVGPSGCGKTTLLRLIAGLDHPTNGTIRIGGQIVNDQSAKSRDIAMVFQNYALYPHMSIYDNMAFSLKVRRTRRREIDRRVRDVAAVLGLTGQLHKRPRMLSGGQRQRVAMGRAIVRQPQAFLMDEPLSNLDAKLRVQMRAEIRRLQRDLGVTTLFVTHDQTEALTLGDLVAVMRQGRVQQIAPPEVLFEQPLNVFVAGFIGSPAMNLVEAVVVQRAGRHCVEFGSTSLVLPSELFAERTALKDSIGRKIILGIRPEDVELADPGDEVAQDSRVRTVVELRETLGREAYLYCSIDAPPLLTADTKELAAYTDSAALEELEAHASLPRSKFVARVNAREHVREGDEVELGVDMSALHFFERETGDALYEARDSGAAGIPSHANPRDSVSAST